MSYSTYSRLCLIRRTPNSLLCLIRTIPLDTLPVLKGTLNSSPRLIHRKNLNSDGDELSVVDCSLMWRMYLCHRKYR